MTSHQKIDRQESEKEKKEQPAAEQHGGLRMVSQQITQPFPRETMCSQPISQYRSYQHTLYVNDYMFASGHGIASFPAHGNLHG